MAKKRARARSVSQSQSRFQTGKKDDAPHWLIRWWWLILLVALIITLFAIYFQNDPLFAPGAR